MRYTNKHELPEWLVDKLIPFPPKKPKKDRMSVTDLIHPPRMKTLRIEKWDEIEEDVANLLQMFDGINLDRAFDEDEEEQLKMEVVIDGVTLVGKLDRLVTNGKTVILDRKRGKVGVKEYPSTLKEWTAQLNCYAWMYEELYKEKVDRIENHIFYKDWTPVRTSDPSYPKIAYEILKQPLWSREDQENYIRTQLEYHYHSPMDCPEEDRWGSFAVKKEGQKRALRVLKTREECEQWMKENKKGDYIENRDGLRCKFFCPVRNVCPDSPCFKEK